MSGIRQLKRYKFPNKKQKTSIRLSLGEIVLFFGIVTLLLGIFYSIYNYGVYTSGSHEYTSESKGWPIFNPEEAPGNPGRKESAAAGWKIAVLE